MLELDEVRFAYAGGPPYRFSMTAEAGAVTAVRGQSGAGAQALQPFLRFGMAAAAHGLAIGAGVQFHHLGAGIG